MTKMWCFKSSGLRVPLQFGNWVFKSRALGILFPLIPFVVMSLSDQHPYALFVSGGLRSPSLARAQVEVGDNVDAYLVSADVVSF